MSLKLRKTRLKWFGHVERMGDLRQVKRITNATIEGRRPVGRPRMRWRDVLARYLDGDGLSVEEARLEPVTVTNGDISCWSHATAMPWKARSLNEKILKVVYTDVFSGCEFTFINHHLQKCYLLNIFGAKLNIASN